MAVEDSRDAQILNMVTVRCLWCDNHPKIGKIVIVQDVEGSMGMLCEHCKLYTHIIFEPGEQPKCVKKEGCKLC